MAFNNLQAFRNPLHYAYMYVICVINLCWQRHCISQKLKTQWLHFDWFIILNLVSSITLLSILSSSEEFMIVMFCYYMQNNANYITSCPHASSNFLNLSTCASCQYFLERRWKTIFNERIPQAVVFRKPRLQGSKASWRIVWLWK